MDELLHAAPTLMELIGVVLCIGSLSCRIWILPEVEALAEAATGSALRGHLDTLLGIALGELTLGSFLELASRASEMSGRPLSEVSSVLPTILFSSHYGKVWLAGIGGLATWWIAWWMGKRHGDSRCVLIAMSMAGALTAWMLSASGHAADWGLLTRPQLVDWLHVMAGSIWGGGLLAYSIALGPVFARDPEGEFAAIAASGRRLSSLAGIAMAVVLASGIYNAWVQVASFEVLWTSSYGRILLGKLLVVASIVVLGALSRYSSVARFRAWTTPDPTDRRPGRRSFPLEQATLDAGTPLQARIVRRFLRAVSAEAVLMLGVLIFVALLAHAPPALD